MADEVIGFIGAGRVGRALAALLGNEGYPISTVVDVIEDRARDCQRICGAWSHATDAAGIDERTSVLVVAVPDGEIERVAVDLAKSNVFREDQIVAHTSGYFSSDLLAPLRQSGVRLCSLHPCYSFTEDSEGDLTGIYYALEGDREGCRRLEEMIRRIGGQTCVLSAEGKKRYHVACTMASNYLVSLMYLVSQLLEGVGEEVGVRCVFPLVEGTLAHVQEYGTDGALTGPVLRGDAKTIAAHLETLSGMKPEIRSAYASLGKATLRMTERMGLRRDRLAELEDLFRKHGQA